MCHNDTTLYLSVFVSWQKADDHKTFPSNSRRFWTRTPIPVIIIYLGGVVIVLWGESLELPQPQMQLNEKQQIQRQTILSSSLPFNDRWPVTIKKTHQLLKVSRLEVTIAPLLSSILIPSVKGFRNRSLSSWLCWRQLLFLPEPMASFVEDKLQWRRLQNASRKPLGNEGEGRSATSWRRRRSHVKNVLLRFRTCGQASNQEASRKDVHCR